MGSIKYKILALVFNMPILRDWPKYFSDRVIVDPETGCWNWTKGLDRHGRARCAGSIDGGNIVAARLVYSKLVGPIPEGLWVLHECDNKRCVNPAHLYPETHQRNMDDRVERGQSGNVLTSEAVK